MARKKATVATTFSAIDKISRPLKKINKAVNRMALAAGAGVAAAGAIVGKMTLDYANAGDQIAKTSRRIGVSAEALQELRFAADRSGISSEKLDDSLMKLNKNVGDLRAGTGSLKTTLAATNPELAEQLKNAESNEKAFELMTGVISKIKNPMDRAALAQAAFGRSGQQILTLTEDGTEGIEKLRKEARKYGDIITNESAKGSEKFVDALTNLKATINGVKNKAIAPLVVALTPLIQKMADWVVLNQKFIGQKIQKIFTAIKTVSLQLVAAWKSGLIPTILILGGAIKGLSVAMAIFNAISGANPILLIIVGAVAAAAALSFGIVKLVQHWDKVKSAVQSFGVAAFGVMRKVGAFIFDFVAKPIKAILSLISKIPGVGKLAGGAISSINGLSNTIRGGEKDSLVSANQGMMESKTANSSTLDVNFNNAPAGTSFSQKGKAPGLSISTGVGMAGL